MPMRRSRKTAPFAKVTMRWSSSVRTPVTQPGAMREGPVAQSPITAQAASADVAIGVSTMMEAMPQSLAAGPGRRLEHSCAATATGSSASAWGLRQDGRAACLVPSGGRGCFMLLTVVADYGTGDLAFAEVRQRLALLLPDADVTAIPVPAFDTVSAGFCVAQLAFGRGPADRVLYANVAPRQDSDAPRAGNAGERLVACRLPTGVLVVGVAAGAS